MKFVILALTLLSVATHLSANDNRDFMLFFELLHADIKASAAVNERDYESLLVASDNGIDWNFMRLYQLLELNPDHKCKEAIKIYLSDVKLHREKYPSKGQLGSFDLFLDRLEQTEALRIKAEIGTESYGIARLEQLDLVYQCDEI